MRVLIVEDERKMAALLKRGLEEEGAAVEIASDGEEGLLRAEGGNFDVILLDLTLPRIDGVEVCRRLREGRVHTPIIMLTARDALDMKIRGLDSGADDYVTKPFAFEELLARIRALLRRDRHEVKMKFRAADLELDPVAHRVTRAGRTIDLTAREYDLLECLMRNQGRVMSRAVLAERVWNDQVDPLTNVVDVYVNYLRNKVDRDFSPKLIHTVRGAGYVLREEAGEEPTPD